MFYNFLIGFITPARLLLKYSIVVCSKCGKLQPYDQSTCQYCKEVIEPIIFSNDKKS